MCIYFVPFWNVAFWLHFTELISLIVCQKCTKLQVITWMCQQRKIKYFVQTQICRYPRSASLCSRLTQQCAMLYIWLIRMDFETVDMRCMQQIELQIWNSEFEITRISINLHQKSYRSKQVPVYILFTAKQRLLFTQLLYRHSR